MPKYPSLTKAKKDKEGRSKLPQTPDEHTEAGLAFEDSGDRWRAADKAKCARFYLKAISCYDTALRLDPRATDAAYNRARLELALGTEEGLAAVQVEGMIPGGAVGALTKALESHLLCLQIGMDQEEDVLFNTGQVYVALAEELVAVDANLKGTALDYVLKGVEKFDAAYRLQDAQHQKVESGADMDMTEDDDENGGVKLTESPTSSPTTEAAGESHEQWVHIKQPITKLDLIDTLLAKLQALTLLCSLLPTPSLATMLEITQTMGPSTVNTLNSLLSQVDLSTQKDLLSSATLAISNFTTACADVQFKHGLLTPPGYADIVSTAFPTDVTDVVILTNKAEAYLQLAQTLFEHHNNLHGSQPNTPLLRTVLTHYTTASTLLTTASTLQPPPPATLHILRGDIELLRSRIYLLLFPTAPPSQLRKNAAVYYRGASRVGEAQGASTEVRREAKVKEGMAEIEIGIETEDYERVEKGKNVVCGEIGWMEIISEAVRMGTVSEVVVGVLSN